MTENDFEVLNKASEVIENLEREYYTLRRKYARTKGNVLDGGYWREIDAKEMTTEDCERFIQLTKDVKWIDNNLGTSIISDNFYFKV